MKKAVIIVAGGRGSRMDSDLPKQFLVIGKYPVLMYTIKIFYEFNNQMRIIVVLPRDQIEYWKNLCSKYKFSIAHKIVPGGNNRFFSVKNGIDALDETDVVAIHDGVRPFVSNETISNSFIKATKFGNAIPVIDVNESIRLVENGNSKIVDRTRYKVVQTPQVFMFDLLKNAYEQEFSCTFTDDASVLENLGHKIHLVDGNVENIKITYPQDILMARELVKD